jgi:hypothetical protein
LSTRKLPIEKNQSTKLTRFKGRLWVSYIFCSKKDFEERKSSIEILTKVVLRVFLQTYGFRMSKGRRSFPKGFIGRLVKVYDDEFYGARA